MKRFKWMTAVLMLVMVMSIGLAGCESAAEQGLDDGVGSYEETKDSMPAGTVG